MITVHRHADGASFLDRAGPWLLEREAEHTLILGLAHRYPEPAAGPDEEPRYFATVERDGRVAGCAFRTPPHKVGLTRMPLEAVATVAEDVAAVYEHLPAVLGPDAVADAFARRWAGLREVEVVQGMRQRIHLLTEVEPQGPLPPGSARLARPEDRERLVEWWRAFEIEAGVPTGHVEAAVDRRLEEGRLVVWDDEGPRAFAGVAARTPGGARVGPVYTPPDRRGRGYGTALVAYLSRHLLDTGCSFCCLYTDLANPTSNAIYRRIGYRPLLDVKDVRFREPGSDG